GSQRKAAAAKVANPWLPAGVTPAGNGWPSAGGDSASSSYSTLTQINAGNVSKLKLAWQSPPPHEGSATVEGPENIPLVETTGPGVTNLPVATTMFLPVNNGMVALDPTTGKVVWQYKGAGSKTTAKDPTIASSLSSRAVAYGDGMVFGGQ